MKGPAKKGHFADLRAARGTTLDATSTISSERKMFDPKRANMKLAIVAICLNNFEIKCKARF
jgi:hypothetical protein